MCAKDVALGDGCGTRTLECVLVCALECVSVGSFGPGLESPPFFFRRDCNLASTEESNAMAICRRLSVRPPAASPAGAGACGAVAAALGAGSGGSLSA